MNIDERKSMDEAFENAAIISLRGNFYKFRINSRNYTWSTSDEKIAIVRSGLPYAAIESISRLTKIPVKHYLNLMEIVQTTYNKKKKDNKSLCEQHSELIMELIELYCFRLSVFNNEKEKFQRWLKKSNISL